MRRVVTFEQAETEFSELLERVSEGRDVVVVRREGAEDVALVAAAELRSLRETVHLLGSRANAERLFDALDHAEAGEGVRCPSTSFAGR